MRQVLEVEGLKLSRWYDAVRISKAVLQKKVAVLETNGYVDPGYYMDKVEDLEDLEMFLKMSLDQWLDSVFNRQTAVEETK
jgi:hypothetical protein